MLLTQLDVYWVLKLDLIRTVCITGVCLGVLYWLFSDKTMFKTYFKTFVFYMCLVGGGALFLPSSEEVLARMADSEVLDEEEEEKRQQMLEEIRTARESLRQTNQR